MENGNIKLKLLTFYTEDFADNARNLMASAKAVGFAECIGLTSDYYKGSDFEERNKKVLTLKKGAGYWLWKPYIIKEELKKLKDGELLFYCDAGRTRYYEFESYPDEIVRRCFLENKGFLLGPSCDHFGPLSAWTKSDCIKLMNASKHILSRPLLMTWSVWSNCANSHSFLDQWLKYAEDERCLTDVANTLSIENYREFRAHRHDQSILSILCYQNEAPYIKNSNSIVDILLKIRPQSLLAMNIYKRPQNINDILKGFGIIVLVREFLRLRKIK